MSTTTALVLHEEQIHVAYLKINLPPTEEFFATVKALYNIRESKLYKQRNFKSFQIYLLDKWELKKSLGNRLCVAGRVISELEKKFPKTELPSNATLCIAVEAWSQTRKEPLHTVWKAALDHFGSRDNAIASHFSEIYEDEDPLTPVSPTSQSPEEPTESEEENSDSDEERSEPSESSSLSDNPVDTGSSAANTLLGRGQRLKRPVAMIDSSGSDSDNELILHRQKKNVDFRRIGENENIVHNTPQWLCDLIEEFTGGVDLDPCSNTFSKLRAKKKYGYDADNTFINALKITDWEPNTNFVYLNAPGTAMCKSEKDGKKNAAEPASVLLEEVLYRDA
ncbi:hypothetical protein PhCBS80983_g06284 [Powellomyces hirtus]|uniref:Uncharacterized protein n=1 Tax=Powellomyces hirtus TaxID=109895 RepID=A0A507DQD7_9FUNG|nr:hypothetical protein PhCBS80983_g06284 [Powellomyces hirtus]